MEKIDIEAIKSKRPLRSGRPEEVLTPVNGDFNFKNKYMCSSELKSRTIKVTQKNSKVKEEERAIQRDDIEPYISLVGDNEDEIFFDIFNLFDINEDIEEEYKLPFRIVFSQRSYKGILDSVVNDLNFVINQIPHIATKFSAISTKTYKLGAEYTEDEFFTDIQSILEDESFRNVCKTIVDSTYEISLDQINIEAYKSKKTEIKRDLQVTDQVNKSFIQAGIMQRCMIPVVSQYYDLTSKHFCITSEDIKERTNRGFLKVFNYTFLVSSVDYQVQNLNKLYKIVEPKVFKTQYNNRVIWSYLNNRSIDPTTVINSILNKIIKQINCKILVNASSVSFFTSVINNLIEYEFKAKHKIKIRTMNLTTSDDDDDDSGMDRFLMNNYHKTNERLELSNKITIIRFVRDKIKEYDIKDEEIDFIYDRFNSINEYQTEMLSYYYSDVFDNKIFSRRTVATLLLIMYKELKDKNMDVLAKLIISKAVSGSKGKNVGKLPIDVLADKYYTMAWNMYNDIADITERDNFILRLALINNYQFEFETYYDKKELIDELDRKALISQVSQFITSL